MMSYMAYTTRNARISVVPKQLLQRVTQASAALSQQSGQCNVTQCQDDNKRTTIASTHTANAQIYYSTSTLSLCQRTSRLYSASIASHARVPAQFQYQCQHHVPNGMLAFSSATTTTTTTAAGIHCNSNSNSTQMMKRYTHNDAKTTDIKDTNTVEASKPTTLSEADESNEAGSDDHDSGYEIENDVGISAEDFAKWFEETHLDESEFAPQLHEEQADEDAIVSQVGGWRVESTILSELREKDLEEHFTRGGGRGGQKVNKSTNAVCLKHVPTGTVIKVHKHRSLEANRKTARRIMREKLQEIVVGYNQKQQMRAQTVRKRKSKQRSRAAKKYHSSDAVVDADKVQQVESSLHHPDVTIGDFSVVISAPGDAIEVRHEAGHRFVVTDPDSGSQAYIGYRFEADAVNPAVQNMTMFTTYVPPELTDTQTIELLALASFEYARSQSIRVVPACSYLADIFVSKYPELASQVLAQDVQVVQSTSEQVKLTADGDEPAVWHDAREKQIVVRGSNGAPDAYIAYREDTYDDKPVLVMFRTFVPPEFRGMRLAGRLAEWAFRYADQNSLHVGPACSYLIDSFIPKNPEFSHLVVPWRDESSLTQLTADGDEPAVWHDAREKQIVVRGSNGAPDAYIAYREDTYDDKPVLVMFRTFVPPEFRGMRLAGRLAEWAFRYADQKSLRVGPACSYLIDSFIPKNPEFSHLVVPWRDESSSNNQ
jgi:predicted GNAT family acetyltransferase